MVPFLLVSSPSLVDTAFGRSVILVWQHDEAGAIGVVINKVSVDSVLNYLPDWSDAISQPQHVFLGGPVEVDTAIAITLARPGSVLLSEGLALVDLEASSANEGAGSVRVFAGYSGWSAGQLDQELAERTWLVAPFEPGDLLARGVGRLWADVVARLGPEHQFLKNLAASQRVN